MPCNAVATVRATVAQDVLDRLMASHEAFLAIQYWLNQHVGAIVTFETRAPGTWSVVARAGRARIYLSRGSVTVKHPYRDIANDIKSKLEGFLPKLANALLATEVKSKLAAQYGIVQEQTVGNATVLTLEV